MKKITSIFICCILIVSCMVPCAFAFDEQSHLEQEIMEPRYEIISIITATLNISDSGRAECYSAVKVPTGYKVELLAELQQNNGGRWETIRDWEASGSNRVSVSGPWYVMPGYSYRLKVTVTAYDSNGNFIESPVEYSPTRDY